jgi:hypothetical protein
MNTLRIDLPIRSIDHPVDEHSSWFTAAQIQIDQTSLIDLLRQFEQPLADREGSPNLAGSYGWLDKETAKVGLQGLSNFRNSKIMLLGCTCGIDECWPLLARVEMTETSVIWRDFEQPYRSENHPNPWDYSGFGPFVFDRNAYQAELEKLLRE